MLKEIGFWKEEIRIRLTPFDKFLVALGISSKKESLVAYSSCNPESLPKGYYSIEEKEKIVSYLDSGVEYNSELGFSWCRFKCGIENRKMGSKTLTDGEWVWPEGYSHYIQEHDLLVPDFFFNTMVENQWKIPDFDIDYIRKYEETDRLEWNKWCIRNQKDNTLN